MVYISNLEAARDYIDITKKLTSKLIKVATRTPKSILEMKIPKVKPYSQFDKTKEYEKLNENAFVPIFRNKEEFISLFPEVKSSRDYFIPHNLFDHGASRLNYQEVKDDPHIWIVAAAFTKWVDYHQGGRYMADPNGQVVTDILNTIAM